MSVFKPKDGPDFQNPLNSRGELTPTNWPLISTSAVLYVNPDTQANRCAHVRVCTQTDRHRGTHTYTGTHIHSQRHTYTEEHIHTEEHTHTYTQTP